MQFIYNCFVQVIKYNKILQNNIIKYLKNNKLFLKGITDVSLSAIILKNNRRLEKYNKQVPNLQAYFFAKSQLFNGHFIIYLNIN